MGKDLMALGYKKLMGGFFLTALHLPRRRVLLLMPPEGKGQEHSGMGWAGLLGENLSSSREEPILNCSLLTLVWAVPFCWC